MKRIQLLAVLSAALFMVSCGGMRKLKDMQVSSVKIESVTPSGLKSLKARFSAVVNNPGIGFEVSDISGTVYEKGEEFVLFEAESVSVNGKTQGTYTLSAKAKLASGVTIVDVLGAAQGNDASDYTVDIKANVKLDNGLSRDITLSAPLSRFMTK